MSPYHIQIDSLHFHIMKGSLLKGKQISLLPFRLVLTTFLFISKWRGILIKIDIHLVQI